MMVHGGATRSAQVSVQPRTEEAHTYWIRKYIRYCDLRHPRELAEYRRATVLVSPGGGGFRRRVDANQALAAICFLYERVLKRPLARIEGSRRRSVPAHSDRPQPTGNSRHPRRVGGAGRPERIRCDGVGLMCVFFRRDYD